jgi:hypothetical protein
LVCPSLTSYDEVYSFAWIDAGGGPCVMDSTGLGDSASVALTVAVSDSSQHATPIIRVSDEELALL